MSISDEIAKIANGTEETEDVTEVETEVTESEAQTEGTEEEESTEEPEGAVATEEEYSPSFGYKVRDEEFEFDDRVKAAIKTKEDEEYFRDLYTKSGGVDHFKSKISELDESLATFKSKNEEMHAGFTKLREFRDNGNIRELVGALGLTDAQLTDYVLELAKEAELPEEQRTAKVAQREYSTKLAELEAREQEARLYEESRVTELRIQEANNRITTLTATEEGKILKEALSNTGIDLEREIKQYGLLKFAETHKDITPEEAYQHVAGKYKFLLEKQIPTLERKPVLPTVNTGASAQSPVVEEYSLDKLKAIAESISY